MFPALDLYCTDVVSAGYDLDDPSVKDLYVDELSVDDNICR